MLPIVKLTNLYAILPHYDLAAVLGISQTDGLRLPLFTMTKQLHQMQTDQVYAGFKKICPLPFNVLDCLAFETTREGNQIESLFLLEVRDSFSNELPEGFSWIRFEDLHDGLVPECLSFGLSNWLEERNTQIEQGTTWQSSPSRPPWTLPGWHSEAESWITSELDLLNMDIRGIEPLKLWCISAVLRVQSTTSPVFFKASLDLPLFVNEGAVMSGLAQIYPDNIPAPLAVNAARRWMLLGDLGAPIGRSASLAQRVSVFQEMARLQIDSTERINSLLKIGCIDRRIPWLQAHLKSLMADEITLDLIMPAERAALRGALPRLQSMLDELDSLPIPPALLHGDLHTGNVAIRDGKIQFFDWTDAAVSHPFFDLDDVFTADDPAERKILENSYLLPWQQIYPAREVQRAFRLARVVFGLYHAISYQYILNHLEESDRPEINMSHYFLRLVLSGLDNFS
jgi:fructosamine-3-kinase